MTDIVYGVTPEGFVRKTQEIIISEIETDELDGIADDLDVSADQFMGQVNGIFGRQLGICWEQLEICYNGFDPEAAEGRLLEMLCKLTGTFRRGDTASEVVLSCNLDDGTLLENGVAYAAIEDHPDIRWTPSLDLYPSGYTAVGSGAHLVTFVNEFTGPIDGFAGQINVIATPIVGWNTVVNPNDAELGLTTDLDPLLRERRERELATIGSATVRAITANVAQAFSTKITQLTVFENEGDNIDANGLPPHSVEVLIFDGDVPTVVDTALAQVIFESKAGGITTSGNTASQASALVNGVEAFLPVYFSRAAQLPVYLVINLVKKLGQPYIGDEAVKQAVAIAGNAYFAPGDYIIEERIAAFVLACTGVKDITSIALGFADHPTLSNNLPVTIREIGRFSTSHITVVSA